MPDTTPDTGREAKTAGEQLADWLAVRVRAHDFGALAALRRPNALTEQRLICANFADAEEQRPVFEKVGFLFARYHAGAARPHYGFDNVGGALRRIGSSALKGPKNPGVAALFDRIAASHEIPWAHLQHAVERARACGAAPPNWAQLTEDLALWKTRGRPVAYDWARAFYTPTYRNGASK